MPGTRASNCRVEKPSANTSRHDGLPLRGCPKIPPIGARHAAQTWYRRATPTRPGFRAMASSAVKQISSFRRCAGLLSRLAYQRAQREGVAVGPLIEQAGLTTAAIEDRTVPLGVPDQIKFVDLVADALGDKELGFHLAQDFDLREIGLLYYVAASADTLGSALRRAERYSDLQNEGVRLRPSRGKSIRLNFDYSGVARHTDVHQIEFFIYSVIRLARHLTGRTLKPTHVRMIHKIAGDRHTLERLMDCDLQSGSDADQVDFPAASWDFPIVTADPHLHRLCVQSCEEALARRRKNASSLKVKVENAIAALLPHGQARHELVAAQLGMSPRTLARRLSSEGSSFAGILSDIRSALAHRYLADRTLPISQIAWLLGYTEIGTFTRAFQRWTGMSPSAARAQQLQAGSTAEIGRKRQISGSKRQDASGRAP
jgi:AraC-like DNA-binding protein